MGFSSHEWFYGHGYELIGVALAYGCELIDLVVGCCGLCHELRPCGGWMWWAFFFFPPIVVCGCGGSGWWR